MAESRAKKTNLACDSCRRRKRKCDGRTPICSLCEKGNIECVYDATLDQRRPAQKNYVAALEARVALLEGILRDAGASDVPGPSGIAPVDDFVDPTPQQTRAASPVAPPSTSADAVAQPDLGAEPKYVPADGAVEALKLMAEPQVQQDPAAVTEELDLGMEGYEPLVSFATEHKLLAQFWDWQRMHLPYVAPVPLLSAYAIYSEAVHPDEPIPPPPPPPPPNPFGGPTAIGVPRAADVPVTPDLPHFISPLLLDCMFAVAALFHGNSETSQLFYERAKLKMLEEVAKPRLATVQAVLLMATWELGHARAPAAWTLSGVAVALCVRLGMNIDASPLVRSGAMSKRLFETRNFVFWATYNFDRFYATLMGMHPLMDRRIISTPRHSSLATANVADGGKPIKTTPSASTSALSGPKSLGAPPEKPTASDVAVSWWSPSTLGMGDVLIQAAWEAVRDLIRLTDMLFDGIYAFNAPKRTPQENLELVTRNNLAVQRFLDDLPTWLRSTGAIRRKDNGLVYLHLCVHLTSILASRPFMSERPHPEEPSRTDPTVPSSQPTEYSQITRRYRALAFRVARASALQVMSLIRHIPLSSPCVTLPYIVYSASTILLLCPDDLAAMDAVRTGIACLDAMNDTGYWIESARDACDRVKALARRWGVVIAPSKRVLGPVGNTSGPGGGGSGSGGAGSQGSGNQDNSEQGSGAPGSSAEASSNMPSNSGSGAGSTTTTRPATSAETGHSPEDHAHYAAQHPPSVVPDIPTGYQEVPAASEHVDVLSQLYAAQIYSGELVPDPNQNQIYPHASQPQCAAVSHALLGIEPSQGYTGLEPQNYPIANPTQNYASVPPAQIPEQYHNTSFTHTSGAIPQAHEAAGGHAYIPAQQPTQFTQTHMIDAQTYPPALDDIQSYLQSEPTSHVSHLQYARDPLAARRRQEIQRQQQYEQSQYRQASSSSSRTQAHPYQRPPQPKPRKIPHVAYALSHAEPEHDQHLPHTHWHAVLPADPTLPFPPDPTACMDIAACFSHTIEHTKDPAFLDAGPDPYASVAVDWLADSSCSFPAMTLDMYAGSSMSEGQTIYAREAGDPYGGGYGGYEHGGGYGGGYGGPGAGM